MNIIYTKCLQIQLEARNSWCDFGGDADTEFLQFCSVTFNLNINEVLSYVIKMEDCPKLKESGIFWMPFS